MISYFKALRRYNTLHRFAATPHYRRGAQVKPAAIAAGIVTLIWLIWRSSTSSSECLCPNCGWEVSDDE